MAERGSWAVQQVGGVGVQTVEDARHSMGALWVSASAITNRSGLVPSNVTTVPGSVLATGTPNTFVHVQPFRYVLQSVRGGGVYVLCLDAIKDIDILNPANGGTSADPSNPRIDLIIAQQNDTYFGDADSNMRIKRIGGTPAASPVDPTVTGSTDYVLLARVTVPANATTITTGNIANVALNTAVTAGGLLPVATNTQRDALANPYDGMPVYRKDVDWTEVYDGAAWRSEMFVKTSALANITNPATGQLALLTTDGILYEWNGSAWVGILKADGSSPRGRLGGNSRAGASATIGTTETVMDTVTLSGLLAGRRVRFGVFLGIVGVSGVGSFFVNLRYASGGTLTTAGTAMVPQTSTNIVTLGNFEPRYAYEGEFIVPSSGTWTVGWTLKANAGTVRSDGGSYWRVDDVSNV